jgi:hypothetical protein
MKQKDSMMKNTSTVDVKLLLSDMDKSHDIEKYD